MTSRNFLLQLLVALILSISAQCILAIDISQVKVSNSSGAFVPNRGQVENETKDSIHYHCRIGAMDVYFKKTGFSYVLNQKVEPQKLNNHTSLSHRDNLSSEIKQFRLDVDFKGANSSSQLQPNKQQIGYRNYVLYHSTKDNPSVKNELNFIPCFSELYYRSIYQGIDIRFKVADGSLKYDIILSAGANPNNIQFLYSSLTTIKNGCTVTQTPLGDVIDNAPVAFQESKNSKSDNLLNQVACNFKILSSSPTSALVGFMLPKGYDKSRELIIDPSVIWHKYLSGDKADALNDLVVLSDNSILVCGESTSINYPVTTGLSLQNGFNNMIITKLKADSTILWSTYYGGKENEIASGIDIDKKTNAIYVVGSSSSTDIIFSNAPSPSNSGGTADAILVKLNPDGTFNTGTFHGGEQADAARSVVVDNDGNIYIAGGTSSINTFPVIPPAQQPNYGGGQRDAFVAKFRSNQSTVQRLFSTFLGGNLYDEANRIICDNNNNIYVCGNTYSKDFPKYGKDVLQTELKSTTTDQADAFIASYGPGGIARWSTYFGGDQSDEGNSLSIKGNLLAMTGSTSSSTLPIYGTKQVFKRGLNLTDSYVVVASIADNNSVTGVWSSFFGGNEGADPSTGIVLTADSLVIIAGYSGSTDFPLKRSVGKRPTKDDAMCYISALKINDSLSWSSTFEIEKNNYPSNIKIDSAGNLVTCFQVEKLSSNNSDGYVLKICPFTPSVRVFPKQSDTLLCEGGTLTLLSDANALDVQWRNSISANVISTPTISVSRSAKYWYTARNSSGCTSASDTVNIIIQPPINVTITTQGNRTTLCEGESVTLSTSDYYSSYRWIDATADTLLSISQTYKAERAGRYILEVSDAVGCKGKSQPLQITEIKKPIISFKGVTSSRTIDSLKAVTTLCAGDSILISPSLSGIGTIRWSDNIREISRLIKSDTVIYAFIVDNTNCTWKSDSIRFVFTPSVKPEIQITDKTCINSIVTVNAISSVTSASYVWQTDGGVILGSSNSASVQIRWSTKGKKNISVGFDTTVVCWQSASDSIVIEDELVGKIQTNGRTILCPQERVILSAPLGYKNYIWNTGQRSSQISVPSPTKLKDTIAVQFESDAGCIGYDTVIVERNLSVSLSENNHNYGSVRIDSSSLHIISMVNNAKSAFTYSAELLDPLLRHFIIDSIVPPIGVPVSTNDTARIYVRFKPGNVNTLTDSVRIKILSPCVDSFFVSLQGIGKGIPPVPIMRFELSNFSYTSSERGIRIPVKAWLVPNVATLTFDTLLFTFEYNSTMLNINGVSRGNIISNTINEYPIPSSITISLPIQTLNFTPTVITEILADGLLGNQVSDSIKISDADVRPISKKEFAPFSAICTNSDVCQSGGSRLLGKSSGLTMMIAPNPATRSIVTISTTDSENSPISLSVYSTNGELYWKHEWIGNTNKKREHVIPSGLLTKGVYSVVLRSATMIERTIIVVLD
jgi:hypothetical protein